MTTINDTIRQEDSTLGLPAHPATPPTIPPLAGDDLASLRKTIQPIKQWIELRDGASGSVMDKHLTLRDLVDAGAVALAVNGKVIGGSSNPVILTPQDAKYNDPRPYYLTPPTLTGLTAAGAFKNVVLSWTRPDYANHSYTEIWRATSSALGAATLIGQEPSTSYADASVLVGGTYWYWVRDVNSAGVHGAFDTVPGTSAALLTIAGTDLGAFVVSADKLSQGTYPNINLIANPGSEDGMVSWELNPTSAGATFTVTTADKSGGASSFLLHNASIGVDNGWANSTAFPVIPGETYSVKMMVRASTATAGGLYIRMHEGPVNPRPTTPYLNNGNKTSFTDLYASGPVPSTWTLKEFAYTIPAGVYWVSMTIIHYTTSTAADLYFDDCSVGRQITATFLAANSIAVGTAAIQNGAIANAMIANLAVDNAKIANLDGAKINANTITAGQIAANTITAGQIAASTITGTQIAANTVTATNINSNGLTIKDTLGNIVFSSGSTTTGSGNLATNGDFKLGSGPPTGFNIYATPVCTQAISTGGPMQGSNFWRITNTGAAVSGGVLGFYFNNISDVTGAFLQANTTYCVSFYARLTANGSPSGMQATWNNGPSSAYFLQNPNLQNGTWNRYVLVENWGASTLDPNGTFFYVASQNIPINQSLDIACVQWEQGNSPSGWSSAPITTNNQITSTNQSTFIASLNASVIVAGSITTAKIFVSAVTAASAAAQSGGGGTFTAVTSVTASNVNVITGFTTTGAPVTQNGTVTINMSMSNSVDSVDITVNQTLDAATVRSWTFRVKTMSLGGTTTWLNVTTPVLNQSTPSAAAHNYGYQIAFSFLNSAGASISSTGTYSTGSYYVAQENKV